MKKITSVIIGVFLLILTGYFTFAKDKTPDEIGRDIAQGYLESALIDDNWKKSHPFIAGEYNYYTDKDTISYKEYKVSCDTTPHCGWIIVNIDGDDVSIPVMATHGMTNYETLGLKLDTKLDEKRVKNKGKSRKAYYFGPFEQYITNENGEVENIGIDQNTSPSKEVLDNKVKKSKDYKSTDTFKETKKQLKEKGLTSYEQKSLFGILKSYAAVNSPTNKWVAGSNSVNCGSRIPCYQQFKFNYSTGECNTGCVPTGIAMIYGYHDRQGTFPNLVSGTAPDVITNSGSNLNVTTMINTIRGQVQTTCGSAPNLVGSTSIGNSALGIQYAKDKGYLKSKATVQTSSRDILLQAIKNQIDINNPVLVGIQGTTGHAIVAWGYSTVSDSRMIRVNYGWGKDSRLYNIPTNQLTASVDVNIDSLTINNTATSTGTITSITRFTIAP